MKKIIKKTGMKETEIRNLINEKVRYYRIRELKTEKWILDLIAKEFGVEIDNGEVERRELELKFKFFLLT